MSVATEIGNGHWIAVQPQDYSYQCYQWSGLLATHPCEGFIYRSTSFLPLIQTRLVGQSSVWERIFTMDLCFLFFTDSVIGLINRSFGTVLVKTLPEGGTNVLGTIKQTEKPSRREYGFSVL